ncbi:MAG: InlB B-repeat-containing protein [Treponema sp.]|jgi:uncharacterized repeat protein (TIGR02543 family)|nr:InlB B-repeat-containing protein [Treponema sp.]
MKNKSLYLGIALAVAMSLVLSACKDDEDPATVTYTVTFNTGSDGPKVDSATVNAGAKVSKPTDPAKTDYTFGGWFKEAGGTNAWNFDTDTVTADTTLYAKWTATFDDVKSTYSLSTSTNSTVINPAGLSIESARKDKTTGVTTIVLSGTIAHGIPTGLEGDFIDENNGTLLSGIKYSAFTIKGLVLGAGVTIKQTNNSLILYKNFKDKGQAVETNGTYVKEKTYTTDPNVNDFGEGFDMIFADGVTPETAMLEITPAGGTKYTVIIDWSNVTFR